MSLSGRASAWMDRNSSACTSRARATLWRNGTKVSLDRVKRTQTGPSRRAARQLARGAQRDVLFKEPVRADRAGRHRHARDRSPGCAAAAGSTRRRLRLRRGRFALRGRLGGTQRPAAEGGGSGAGREPAKPPPRDAALRHATLRHAALRHDRVRIPHPRPPRGQRRRPGRNMREGAALRQIGAVVGRPTSVRRKTTQGAGSTRPKPRRIPT